ncbi:RNA polymerase sigma factor [Rhizobium sp. SYY.PMSO]|uniref:RNA polymerase sigma factor n=1 Tax=Rhizobium sp. SYY.PMSO TaxID=3382192 RepID=UPI00398FABAD
MDDAALKKLFVAHKRELQSYLTKKLRDPDLASDLTQETFLRFAEHKREGPAQVKDDRSYLYRTAHNLAIDHVRKRSRQKTDSVPPESLSEFRDEHPTQEDETDARLRLSRLRDAVAELPELTRRIFVLNRVEGLTYSEVANRLSISDSSVQKHLAKALFHVTRKMGNPR